MQGRQGVYSARLSQYPLCSESDRSAGLSRIAAIGHQRLLSGRRGRTKRVQFKESLGGLGRKRYHQQSSSLRSCGCVSQDLPSVITSRIHCAFGLAGKSRPKPPQQAHLRIQ